MKTPGTVPGASNCYRDCAQALAAVVSGVVALAQQRKR